MYDRWKIFKPANDNVYKETCTYFPPQFNDAHHTVQEVYTGTWIITFPKLRTFRNLGISMNSYLLPKLRTFRNFFYSLKSSLPYSFTKNSSGRALMMLKKYINVL